MTGPFQPIASESVVAAAPAREHRRGLVIMLLVAAVLLAGGVAAVVLILGNDNGDESGTLAHSIQYDNSRPDDMPRPKNMIEAVTQGAQIAQQQPQHQKQPPHQQIHYPNQPDVPETPGDPTKSKIKPEEIEDIANKNAEGTKRCYMRAQKGTLGIDVAEIKRIDVLFTLDPTGTVTTVSLSDHTNDQFGQCLIARVKAWKFRASPGGQFKFPLVFAN